MSTQRAKKVLIISSVILVVSIGLCGANLLAFNVFHLGIGGGPSPGPHGAAKDATANALTLLAFLEVGGMLMGTIGMLISLIVWMGEALIEKTQSRNQGDE